MPRQRSGFTLVELLIVISVMAILMGLLFPIARTAMDASNRTVCMSNMRMIAQAVAAYQQDHLNYPEMPGAVGLRGIPTGGVTELVRENLGVSPGDLWCSQDPYPENFLKNPDPKAERDSNYSTYALGYNYYGYVTDTMGMPFPITSLEAAEYLYDANSNWDLQLINNGRPAGLFPGLWNVNPPSQTVITFCPHHPTEKPKKLPVVMLSGEAMVINFARVPDPSLSAMNRQANNTRQRWPIDWRINKAPLLPGKAQDDQLFGDSKGNASANIMPLVDVTYRQFTNNELANATDHWYDAGVSVKPGDLLMVAAHARWTWDSTQSDWPSVHKGYASLVDDAGKLYFTASGDPVTAIAGNESLLGQNAPAAALIGRLVDTTTGAEKTYRLDCRGSLFVPDKDDANPARDFTDQTALYLSANAKTVDDFSAYRGWCEVWIAKHTP